MNGKIFVLMLLLILAFSGQVLAAAPDISLGTVGVSSYSPANYFWVLLRTSVSLIIILGLIYFLTRILLKRPPGEIGPKTFHIYQRLPLEPQVCLYLIKVAGAIILIGVGGKKITLLESFSEKDFPEKEIASAGTAGKFSEILQKFSGRLKEKKDEN